MQEVVQRTIWTDRTDDAYKWVRAAGVAALTFAALRQLPSYNPGLELVLLLAIVLLASVTLPGAILTSLLVIGFPIFYSSPVVGIAFAVIAVVSFQYLSLVDGRGYFLLGFLLIAAYLKIEWAFPLLAGFYLASKGGFALGAGGVLLIEAMGLLLGRQTMGSIYANGSKHLWTIVVKPLPSLLDWSWVAPKFSGGQPMQVLTGFAKQVITSAALVVQPLVWGAVGAFVGSSAEKRWKNILVVFALSILALFTLTWAVGSVTKSLDGGMEGLLARAVFGFGASMAPVATTMLADWRKRSTGVVAGTVAAGPDAAAPFAAATPPVGAIDSLTGLYRREHLDQMLPAQLEAARQTGSPVGFAMIDLDRFKQVNDTKGHQAGDRVLADVAGLLRSVVNTAGDVVRYGGDEFCVILPGSTAEGAMQIMNEAAARLETLVFTGLENVLRPTFSIGIAEFPTMAATKEDLVEYADQALYISKNMGRNTITVYGEEVFLEQALELECWMAMQCFLTVNGRIRADSWRLHLKQKAIEIVTAFDYTATIPYVSKTASVITRMKTYKSSFEGKILRIASMSDSQTQFVILVQRADLPLKIREHLDELEPAQPVSPRPVQAGSPEPDPARPL